MKKILFSDIDGCIINEPRPHFNQINAELSRLVQTGFNIVLSTAKTAHEMIVLNQHLDLPGPFIIENGGGILFNDSKACSFPDKDMIKIGPYALLKLGKEKPSPLFLTSFSPSDSLLTQMSEPQLLACSNLSAEGIPSAKMRFFTEPILIKNLSSDQIKQLKKQLRKNQFYFVQTKNWLHVCSAKNNHKGAAVQFYIASMHANEQCVTYAIGDSINDFSMLNGCDNSFYILNYPLKHRFMNWHFITEKGFLGWRTALHQIVSSVSGVTGITSGSG